MITHEQIKEKWDNNENLPAHYNHTEIDIEMQKKYNSDFQEFVVRMSKYDFENKIVIDYGCGGGWLGKFLLSKYNIKEYIGIDVSKKSLKFAKKNLKEFENKRLILVEDFLDFSQYNADILITLNCIQHFPDIEYVNKWLDTVNKSNIPECIIQYRINKNNKTYFLDKNIWTWACVLSVNYIDKYLNNYNRWGGFNVFKKDIANRYAYLKNKNIEKAKENNIEEKIENNIGEIDG